MSDPVAIRHRCVTCQGDRPHVKDTAHHRYPWTCRGCGTRVTDYEEDSMLECALATARAVLDERQRIAAWLREHGDDSDYLREYGGDNNYWVDAPDHRRLADAVERGAHVDQAVRRRRA